MTLEFKINTQSVYMPTKLLDYIERLIYRIRIYHLSDVLKETKIRHVWSVKMENCTREDILYFKQVMLAILTAQGANNLHVCSVYYGGNCASTVDEDGIPTNITALFNTMIPAPGKPSRLEYNMECNTDNRELYTLTNYNCYSQSGVLLPDGITLCELKITRKES